MPTPPHRSPTLLLGPLLRYVGPTSATVWVETAAPCTVVVEVAGRTARAHTFAVAGHHYALVVVEGLAPGTDAPYTVHLDGAPVWPPTRGHLADWPASRIRTPADDDARIVLGSCRAASPGPVHPTGETGGPGGDCLDALALTLREDPSARPDLLLLLGDQVYADETSPAVRRRIAERRGRRSEPRGQVRDFEEYTWLYQEAWGDPPVRWLLSTVPSAMVFDDHDVHDDWNTSGPWRADMRRTAWWSERIVGALQSYVVHQHLGNLCPEDLATDPTARALLGVPHPGIDVEPLLRRLAVAADAEADGAKGYRWSYVREVGRTRVVVLDSRCGRILDGGPRLMMSADELGWAAGRMRAPGADHVVVATSLPWLLAPALDAVEGWNERLCERPGLPGRLGEALRRAADLEHWAAFRRSAHALAAALRDAAAARDGGPASVSVVSGDVHHSYVGRALLHGTVHDGRAERPAPVHQVTCSPLNNQAPAPMRLAFRLAWSRRAERVVRALLRPGPGTPPPPVDYERVAGPVFGNAVATLDHRGRSARLRISTTATPDGSLGVVTDVELTQVRPPRPRPRSPRGRSGASAGTPA